MMPAIKCPQCQQYVAGEAFVHEKGVFHPVCVKDFKAAQQGLSYRCPKCDGAGKVNHYEPEWHNTDGSRWRPARTWDEPCNLCQCQGYLATQPRQVPTGYRWEV